MEIALGRDPITALQDRSDEIPAIVPEDPGDPQDEVLASALPHPDLPEELRPGVDPLRVGRVFLDVRPALAAVEDVVGAVVRDERARLRRGCGEVAGPLGVDPKRLFPA